MLFDRYTTEIPAIPARIFTHGLPERLRLDRAQLAQRIRVPVVQNSAEEAQRTQVRDTATLLAHHGAWDDVTRLLQDADLARTRTPAGYSVATLIAEGARLALNDPDRPEHAAEAIEALLPAHRDNWGLHVIAALTHIDTAWAWRGHGWTHDVPAAHLSRFHAHLDRAGVLLDRFDPFTTGSAMLAGTRCALLAGKQAPADIVADDYEDLIDLDPGNPAHLQALGNALLPRWSGSFARLDAEARRTADRTRDTWGLGGYAWVWSHAICVDDASLSHLDPDLFLSAVADILERHGDAHTANFWAAFLGVTMRTRANRAIQGRKALAAKAKLLAGLHWVVHHHLREIHPETWQAAARRFVPQAAIAASDAADPSAQTCAHPAMEIGTDLAFATLARLYARDIDAGHNVALVPFGPRLC